MSKALYSDGGVVKVNPSPYGGTWAWVLVVDDAVREQQSGLEAPGDSGLEVLSNNDMELVAALRALEAHPGVVLYTDSQVTKYRLEGKGEAPGHLKEWCDRVAATRPEIRLVAGHPTRADLARGKALRNGLPVSEWNLLCDELCKREARRCK